MGPKKQRWMLVILGVLVVSVWVRGLTVKPVRSRHPVSPVQPVNPSLGFETSPQPSRSRYVEWGGNPFEIERRRTPTPAATTPGGHVVSGILWDPQAPSAILNGQLVSQGDRLEDGWEVVEVQRDRVILSNGLTTQTLTVE